MPHIGTALLLAILVVAIYLPGLQGPYILDDEENIVLNRGVALTELTPESLHEAIWSNQSGPSKRPIAALSFALNHYFAGGFDNILAFKLVNVAIHVVNGWLIYCLAFLLLCIPASESMPRNYRTFVAGFTALLWSVHPVQLTNVLYVVQRMNSLSALFVVSGLIVFFHGRNRFTEGDNHGLWTMYAGIAGGVLFGIGAKENAVLLPVLSFVIEMVFFRRKPLPPPLRKKLAVFYAVTLLMPLVLLLAYVAIRPEFLTDLYAMRPFSPHERLLTESRVLWFYLGLLFLPGIQKLGLFHDDIALSTGLLSPPVTLAALTALLAALAFAIWQYRRYPFVCFAFLWFLAGHGLESGVVGLEIAYEHRNYLPSFGIFLGVSHILFGVLFRQGGRRNTALRVGLAGVIITVFAFSTWSWANVWKDPTSIALHHVNHHPNSPKSFSYAANISIQKGNDLAQAIRYTMKAIELSPDETGLRLDMQLYLSYLAFEMNSDLARNNIKISGRSFRVPDLPLSIAVENTSGKLGLSYAASRPETIDRMLREKAISVHGVVALEKIGKCILDGTAYCQTLLPQARAWFAAAAGNPRTTTEYRAIINARASDLQADAGDYEGALERITIACRLFPDSVYYAINRAEYLIKLGRLEEADLLLRQLERPGAAPRRNKEKINFLREVLSRHSKIEG